MKQTAVDWLLDNLISEPYSEEDFKHNSNMWDKAKEMEKQQIIDAYKEGSESGYELAKNDDFIEGYKTKEAEQYYNETFKNK